MDYRIEKDTIGEIKVAQDKYWGAQTERSKNNFKIGPEASMPHEIIEAFAYLKKAAAFTNADLNVLSTEKRDYISQVCDEILAGKLNEHFPLVIWQTGSGTQSNMNVNEVIANRAQVLAGLQIGKGEPVLKANDDVNKSQSSNDTYPTAMHIAAYKAIVEYTIPGVTQLRNTLDKKAKDLKDVVKIGRTHLMDCLLYTSSGTPITVSSPINLATEYRYGFDITLNYTPFKWWKLNGNFNFYRSEINGDYTFTNFDGTVEKENFDQNTYAWFTRITSKITLPYKIDWQVNGMYRAPYDTSQGRAKGNLSANTSLSKDILKDKATITFNVSDIFNSRKRESDTYLPQSISHSEMQWRGRQINLSFTYRFNQSKMNRQKQQKPGNGDGEQGGGEMEMM